MTIAPTASVPLPIAIQQNNGVAALLGTSSTLGLSDFSSASTIVDLSGLGQLLAAADTFQAGLAALQPGSNTGGLGQNFGSDFASLAAEAQNFVDTFNTLQSNLTNVQATLGTLPGGTLATQFAQTLNTQVAAPLDNGNSPLTSLAQIGIVLQPAAGNTAVGGTLSINLATLQSAFLSDQAGSFSLLKQAAQSLGSSAAGLAGQASSAATTIGNFAQFSGLGQTGIGLQNLPEILALAAQSGLNTIGAGLPLLLGSQLSGTGSLGLADLFALEAFNPNTGTTLAQQLTALNQYNLVSILLG